MVAEGYDQEIPDEDDDVIEIDEEASALEKAQAVVGVEGGDPLSALLEWDPSEPIQDTWYCKRLGVHFVYEAFTDDKDYERVVDRATHRRKRRGGAPVREIDSRQLSKLVVINRCVNPVFDPARDNEKFQELATHYGTVDPETLVGKALLPGEIDALADKILTLSGYDDDMEEVAGN